MSQYNDGLKAFTAGEALVKNRRVKLNGSGEAVYADADDVWIGTAEQDASSGDHVTVRMRNCPGTRKMVAAGAITAYANVTAQDDGKIDDALTGGTTTGIALESAGADGDILEVLPIEPASRLLHADTADGTTHTNSTDETALATKTIDGAQLKAGDVLEVDFMAVIPDNNSTDTLVCKLYVGTEVICTTATVDVADGDVCIIKALIQIRVAGASGTLVAHGYHINDAITTAATLFRKAEASEDLSGDVVIEVTGDWSVAHADNQVNSELFTIKLHRQ